MNLTDTRITASKRLIGFVVETYVLLTVVYYG